MAALKMTEHKAEALYLGQASLCLNKVRKSITMLSNTDTKLGKTLDSPTNYYLSVSRHLWDHSWAF